MEISVLRPWAFVFLLPAVLFCFFYLRSVKTWLGIVDDHLLKPLLVRVYIRFKEAFKIIILSLACLSMVFALVGIGIKGAENELYRPKSPAVIVLDMSLSMKVRDIVPNRFSQAVFKVYDLLDELTGIPTALIVFSDEPYQLVPTTTEKEAIKALLPLLNFNLLPSQGSRLDRAIKEAERTIKEGEAEFGDIFVITDGADDVLELQDATLAYARSLAKKGFRLFVLGVGTEQGGILFEKEDVPVLDALGNPVYHRLKEGYLRQLAQAGNGKYHHVRTDGSDIDFLMKVQKSQIQFGQKSDLTDKQSVSDQGYWFLILPVLLFPFLFRQGRLLGIMFVLLFPVQSRASTFTEMFLSPSFAAMRFLDRGDQAKAIKTALDSDNFTVLYNVGTRLIFLQNYPAAQDLLQKGVDQRPDDENAQINLEIAKRLNQNPSPQTSQSGSNEDNQNPDNSGEGKGNSEGENNLNQNNNNNSQQSDNKEKNKNEKSLNTSDDSSDEEQDNQNNRDQNSQNDGDHQSEENKQDQETSEGGGNKENNQKNSQENTERQEKSSDNKKDMPPVYEDPSILLRHKILFLYQEKRYAGDKTIGAKW